MSSLAIVQLSDIHIKSDKDNPVLTQVEKIKSSIKGVCDFYGDQIDHVIILFSGDMSFSGKESEFKIVKNFITSLKNEIQKDFSTIELLFIPGNHDCEFSGDEEARNILIGSVLSTKKVSKSVLNQCLFPQKEYRDFLLDFDNKGVKEVYECIEFNFFNQKICFHLCNSSWISKKDEKPGEIYIPIDFISQNKQIDTNAINITCVHHPFNWFEVHSNQREAKIFTESFSDLIITGHEHVGNSYEKSKNGQMMARYIEGGVLQVNEVSIYSSYNILIMDISKNKSSFFQMKFNSEKNIYENQESEPIWIPTRVEKLKLGSFLLKEEFLSRLNEFDLPVVTKLGSAIETQDIFIYPELSIIKEDDIEYKSRNKKFNPDDGRVKSDNVLENLLKTRLHFIFGEIKSGKSFFAKGLFLDLYNNGYTPILLSELNASKFGVEKLVIQVKTGLSGEYKNLNFDEFANISKQKRILIIDNFTFLATNNLNALFVKMMQQFESIVVFLPYYQKIEIESLRFEDLMLTQFFYEIKEFGKLLRNKLINKWFLINGVTLPPKDETRLVFEREKILNSLIGNSGLPSYPIYLIIILQQISSNENYTSKGNSYSHLYDALIKFHLARFFPEPAEFDIAKQLSSEIAYYMYQKKTKELSFSDMIDIFKIYIDKFDVKIDLDLILNKLTQAKIFERKDQKIMFFYSFEYFYFIASYFSETLEEGESLSEIKNICEDLSNTDNIQICLFLSYLSKTTFITNLIIKSIQNLFVQTKTANLESDTMIFSDLLDEIPEIVHSIADTKRNHEEQLSREDRAEAIRLAKKKRNDEKKILTSDFNISIEAIKILGQILRSQAGSLVKSRKNELVSESFDLTLRSITHIFDKLQLLITHTANLFIEEISFEGNLEINEKQKTILINKIQKLISIFAQYFTLYIIKNLAKAIGHVVLENTFDSIAREKNTLSARIINFSIKLELYKDQFPYQEMKQIWKEVKDDRFSSFIVVALVMDHLRFFPVSVPEAQKICTALGIRFDPKLYMKQIGKT